MKSLIKPAILVGLILLLLVPLGMIDSVISERTRNRNAVVNDIASSWTQEQVVSGPWLVVDYQVTTERRQWDKEKQAYVSTPWTRHKHLLLRPASSDLKAALDVSHRYRGIFQVPVYAADISIGAEFDMEPLQESLKAEEGTVAVTRAAVEIGVSDARGFVATPTIEWGGKRLESLPEMISGSVQNGFHALIGESALKEGESTLKVAFKLRGIESLQALPAGYDSQVMMTSSWPHPSFIGSFLPTDRAVDDNGFQAFWRVSAFAAGISLLPETALSDKTFATPGKAMPMGVRLYEPVDIYTLNERATKYGILFILITFAISHLTELFGKRPVHPMQYGLVGLALVFFFMLLLSLSEHTGFGVAYIIATTVNVGLVGVYVRPLMGLKMTLLYAGLLTLLYGACYAILMLESHALLVGSLLMFVMLAAFMLLTRRIDWYGVKSGFVTASQQKVEEAGS